MRNSSQSQPCGETSADAEVFAGRSEEVSAAFIALADHWEREAHSFHHRIQRNMINMFIRDLRRRAGL